MWAFPSCRRGSDPFSDSLLVQSLTPDLETVDLSFAASPAQFHNRTQLCPARGILTSAMPSILGELLFRPSTAAPVLERQCGGIQHKMPYFLSFPCVSDVNVAVRRLDHCRIGKLCLCFAIKGQCRFPVDAIFADSDVDHFPPAWRSLVAMGVIVDQQVTAILKRHGIYPAIGIG